MMSNPSDTSYSYYSKLYCMRVCYYFPKIFTFLDNVWGPYKASLIQIIILESGCGSRLKRGKGPHFTVALRLVNTLWCFRLLWAMRIQEIWFYVTFDSQKCPSFKRKLYLKWRLSFKGIISILCKPRSFQNPSKLLWDHRKITTPLGSRCSTIGKGN